MRQLFPLTLLLASCASEMHGKWPSLAARPGEIASDASGGATGPCAGCGQDVAAAPAPPPVAPAPRPLPANAEVRLAETTRVIADIEARAPAQERAATAAIAAARTAPDRQGDAEVARSRFESLFMPLSIEERRLDLLTDDAAGTAGADAVMVRIAALRGRIAALQALRVSLPN